MKFSELISNSTLDDHELAKDLVVNNLIEQDDLIACVAASITSRRRVASLTVEKEQIERFTRTVATTTRSPQSSNKKFDPQAGQGTQMVASISYLSPEFRELLNQKVSYDHSRNRRSWGEITLAELDARISMLEKLQRGIGRTVDRAKKMREIMVQAGVNCLNELDPHSVRPADLKAIAAVLSDEQDDSPEGDTV